MKITNPQAFTLAEVLITLGIIGIVASMTLPSLINKFQEKEFKTGYKKAYADLSNALQEGILEEQFNRTEWFQRPATIREFDIIKNKFKVSHECELKDISACWKKGDTLCGGSCSTGNASDGIDMDKGHPSNNVSYCFIDGAGRSWCTYVYSENLFVVDTNGFSNPNKFGKDRWIFTFADSDNKRTHNYLKYQKVIPYINKDLTKKHSFCKRPPCYYQSWLLN